MPQTTQQQLRDKTFKQGQDSRRDRQRGRQGIGHERPQQDLRDRLKKLQQELAERGMGQGQRGEKGEQGQQGDRSDGEDGFGDAGPSRDSRTRITLALHPGYECPMAQSGALRIETRIALSSAHSRDPLAPSRLRVLRHGLLR
jgi:hypothetical protein